METTRRLMAASRLSASGRCFKRFILFSLGFGLAVQLAVSADSGAGDGVSNKKASSNAAMTVAAGGLPIILTAPHGGRAGIAKNGAPEGVMIGTIAIARGRFGQGRVICFSPHPEMTAGLEAFVQDAIDYVNRKQAGQ